VTLKNANVSACARSHVDAIWRPHFSSASEPGSYLDRAGAPIPAAGGRESLRAVGDITAAGGNVMLLFAAVRLKHRYYPRQDIAVAPVHRCFRVAGALTIGYRHFRPMCRSKPDTWQQCSKPPQSRNVAGVPVSRNGRYWKRFPSTGSLTAVDKSIRPRGRHVPGITDPIAARDLTVCDASNPARSRYVSAGIFSTCHLVVAKIPVVVC